MRDYVLLPVTALLGMLLSCAHQQTTETPANESVSSFLSYPNVTDITEDGTGHIWIGTSSGLNKALSYGYHQFFSGTDSLSLLNDHITALFSDSSDRLWIASKDGHLCYLTPEGSFRQVAIEYREKVRISFGEAPSGDVYCDDESAVYRYCPDQEAMVPLVDGPGKNIGFFPLDDRIAVVYPDEIRSFAAGDGRLLSECAIPEKGLGVSRTPDGKIWVFSAGAPGLVIFDPDGMERVPVPANLIKALSGRRIYQIAGANNGREIFMNVGDDILLYDTGSGTVNTLREKGFTLDTQMFDITCVFCDSWDNIWVGTDGGGIQTLHNFHKWTRFQILLDYFKNTPVSEISFDSEDETVFVTNHRGRRYSYKLQEKVVSEIPQENTGARAQRFPSRALHLAEGGTLTVNDNTDIIVSLADSDIGLIIPLGKILTALGTTHFHPTTLFQDSLGQVWIGTKSSGIVIVDLTANTVRAVPGVSREDISAIFEDLDANIWVATKNGIFEYSLDGRQVNSFSRGGREGENAYMDGSFCVMPDGVLLLGTMRGINIINPRQKKESDNGRTLFLEDLRVHNSIVRPGNNSPIEKFMVHSPHVRLSYDQNNFGILFTKLNYGMHYDGSYSYMLEGFNEFWIDSGNAHEAYFSNVPPGKYVFRVRITDSTGTAFECASCKVTISPAPWATPLAKTLYALIAIGLLGLALVATVRYARNRAELRQSEAEIRQEQHMNEILKKYFANVAHQLRTPLTMIHGPIGSLYSSKSIRGEDKKLIWILRHNTDRMLGLVNQIMNLHSLESDALPLQARRCDIVSILDKTLDLYRVNASEKGIRLLCSGLNNNAVVYADAEKIVNILDNLLSNAFKFTPEDGTISVSFLHGGDWAELMVQNSGPVIPEDKLEDIFRRFYQVDSSSKGVVNWGSGIGLYYSRKLASLHHGSLVCRNKENGEGVSFILRWPTGKEAYGDEEIKEGEASGHQPPLRQDDAPGMSLSAGDASDVFKPEVLVVDDDLDVSLYLKTVFSSSFRVRSCYDAESALRVLDEYAPDLIVSDIMMTGLSGLDLCERIKGNLQYCHIPIILLTAKDRVEDQIAGLKTGADAYVTKPFNAEYLLSLAENLVLGRKRLQQHIAEGIGISQDNALSSPDRTFLEQLYSIWDEHLSDPDFNISSCVDRLHMSHTKFIYKVKGLTGFTPSEMFVNYKLNKAASMLRDGRYNVSEVADMTGFGTLAHFSRTFKKKFGVPPSEYKW